MCIEDGNIVIHDRTTCVKIRMDRLVDRIYHFLQVQAFHISISSFDLLHRRLGHPSSSAMNELKLSFFIRIMF